MTVPVCDLYFLYKRVVAGFNAAPARTFTGVINDDRRSAGELFFDIQAAADQVCLAIAETLGHSLRTLFTAYSADLDHGAEIPDSLGPPGQVMIKYVSTDTTYHAGNFDRNVSLADIEHWRTFADLYGVAHNAANASQAGFYRIEGKEIFLTGYRAKLKLANYTRTLRSLTDAAISSSSKNLSSATAAFTSADQYAAVLLDGAGADGLPLVSRIESITNGTTVVLTDASSATVSGQQLSIAKLQAPQSFEDTVYGLSLANVKEGDQGGVLPIAKTATGHIERIRAGAIASPPLELDQAA